MDFHTIAYFIAITILFTSSLYYLITNKIIFDLSYTQEKFIIFIATLLIAYDYSFTHGYIAF